MHSNRPKPSAKRSKSQLRNKSPPVTVLSRSKHSITTTHSSPLSPITTTSRRQFNHSTKQPLSYRHLYHAGNHADVMKHAILLTLASQQARKIPFGRLFIDTHAGPGGTYDLQHEYARKTEEFAHGIGRIYDISRLSALNPHITSETTLRRNETTVDYGYTQDPLYLRLQSPASDLFNPFPFINGLVSPGARTISPQQNQTRGELVVPLMTTPHPLLIAGGDDTVASGLENQVKESYMDRINAMPRKQVLSARRKLQRQLTRIRSQLQSLKNQQTLVKTLKKEFAMLGIQESIEMAKGHVEIREPIGGADTKLINLNNFEDETDLELLNELNDLNADDDDDNDVDPDDQDVPMEDVKVTVHTQDETVQGSKATNPLRTIRPRLNNNVHAVAAAAKVVPEEEMIPHSNTTKAKKSFGNKTGTQHSNSRSAPSPSFHPNFPHRGPSSSAGPTGSQGRGSGQQQDDNESSEVEDDLLNAHADRQYTGPIPEVGPKKLKEYTNAHGERVTFRKIGKSVVDTDGKTKTIDAGGNVVDERALFVKKNIAIEPMRLHTSGFQEDPIKARRRTVNTLTKRLVSAYDPIEEVGESIHELNVAMHIPSKNNNLINNTNLQTSTSSSTTITTTTTTTTTSPTEPTPSHHPAHDPGQLSITRTNQLHTTQLSVYLRHLLPIPNSMLPYISAMTHASKPPTLASIMERPSYADLLVGDKITKEKAKALQERQDRDTAGGSFTTSVKLTKEEKTLFLKEIVNGSILEGYLNNANGEYHDAQHEAISDHLQRGVDELEQKRLPISEFTRRATELVGSNMVAHKPHLSLDDPSTSRSFIPLTMMENEWIHGLNDINPNNPGLKAVSQTNSILTDDLVYPTSTRVPAHAILYAPNPTKRAEQMKKQQSRRSHALNLNEGQLSAQKQGFEVDMQYGLDQIPNSTQRGSDRRDGAGHRGGFANNDRNGHDKKRGFDNDRAVDRRGFNNDRDGNRGGFDRDTRRDRGNNFTRNDRDGSHGHREDRTPRRQQSSSSSPKDEAAEMGINLNALGGNIAVKVNSFEEDEVHRRRDYEDDNNGRAPASFRRENNNQPSFRGGGGNDRETRPFHRGNDRENRSFRGHGDSERQSRGGFNDRNDGGDRGFNNGWNGSKRFNGDRDNDSKPYQSRDRNNDSKPYQPRDKDAFVAKFDRKVNNNVHTKTDNNQTKQSSSLRDLKYSSRPTTSTRNYTTINASNTDENGEPKPTRLLGRKINRSQLPPTLRALAPLARLGVINPGMVTMVLRRHFANQTEAGGVWKDIMSQDKKTTPSAGEKNKGGKTADGGEKPSPTSTNIWKTMYDSEKSEFKKNYNHNDSNPTNPKLRAKQESPARNKFGDKKGSKFGTKYDKREGGSDRGRFESQSFPQHNADSSSIPHRVTPLGDSRRSRDKARSKEERLAIWERPAQSTEMIGMDKAAPNDEKSKKDAAKKDSFDALNQSFVEYPLVQPQLIPKASVKSLYSSSMTPIDKLTQMYFTTMSKSRKQKQKRQKVSKATTTTASLAPSPSLESLLSAEDELQTYRDELDQSVSTLFDEEADSNERFLALQNYEKYYTLAENALSYLTRSLSVYRSDDKLFHIPLAQPLYSSPSSPWLMSSMLRDEIFAPSTETWSNKDSENYQKRRQAAHSNKNHQDGGADDDDDDEDDGKILPNHLPMIKDILVLNELHTTEYQTLRKNTGDTIMGGFYKEAVNDHILNRLEDVLDIKTSTTTTLRSHQVEPDVVPKVPENTLSQHDLDSLAAIEAPLSATGKHQRAQRVPANSNTLGDAIARLAATVVTDTTMGFNPLMQTIGQKYANFNTLPVPATAKTHGAHNIFIDNDGSQIVALQYNGFSSAQIFLKQFQYFTDFVARMSYSALNPTSPGVQYLNKIHDEQFNEYEQRYDNRQGSNKHSQKPFPTKKSKNDNFISTSLMLCDPAYETGEEYVNVLDLLRTTLDFNSQGNAHTLAIWYPILDKIDPSLPDQALPSLGGGGGRGRGGADDDDNDVSPDYGKFDMSTVARRDINRGHFLNSLTRQFQATPKHEHHKLFLSMSSFLVNKYRATLPSPALNQTPYNMQAPTGNLDTVVAETYVGIPKGLNPQRKNIFMSGSGMVVHSPILPQELDQSLSTMLPWISTALHVDSFNNIYNHVVKTKQAVHKQRMQQQDGDVIDIGQDDNRDRTKGLTVNGGADLTTTDLPPLADYTLHWL